MLISVYLILAEYHRTYLTFETIWSQNGRTVAGGNGEGTDSNQFETIGHIYLDENETIYSSDFHSGHLIQWPFNGIEGQKITQQSYAGYNGGLRDFVFDEENRSIIFCATTDRAIYRIYLDDSQTEEIISNVDCFGIALDNERNIYFSNETNHEVRKWVLQSNEDILIAGGNGIGNQTNQFAHPTSIFVDDEQSIYVSDFANRRIMKWLKNAQQGRILASHENGLEQLESVGSILVDHLKNVYVSDWARHRVIRCHENYSKCQTIVGGYETGRRPNQLHFPAGLAFDQYGHLYVADRMNFRIQKFEIESY